LTPAGCYAADHGEAGSALLEDVGRPRVLCRAIVIAVFIGRTHSCGIVGQGHTSAKPVFCFRIAGFNIGLLAPAGATLGGRETAGRRNWQRRWPEDPEYYIYLQFNTKEK